MARHHDDHARASVMLELVVAATADINPAFPLEPANDRAGIGFGRGHGISVNSGLKIDESQRFEIAPRPHLAVDLMVANNGWTAYPVKAVSRRRRGPKARLYRVRRAAKLGHQVDGGQLPSATQPGNFKPLVFGAFRAAANNDRRNSRCDTGCRDLG